MPRPARIVVFAIASELRSMQLMTPALERMETALIWIFAIRRGL
jgi:hypothetical protein